MPDRRPPPIVPRGTILHGAGSDHCSTWNNRKAWRVGDCSTWNNAGPATASNCSTWNNSRGRALEHIVPRGTVPAGPARRRTKGIVPRGTIGHMSAPRIVPRGTMLDRRLPPIVPRGTILHGAGSEHSSTWNNRKAWRVGHCSTWNNAGPETAANCSTWNNSRGRALEQFVPRGTIPAGLARRRPKGIVPRGTIGHVSAPRIVPRGTMPDRRPLPIVPRGTIHETARLSNLLHVEQCRTGDRRQLFHVEQFSMEPAASIVPRGTIDCAGSPHCSTWNNITRTCWTEVHAYCSTWNNREAV
jgi:hypothetical protein